VENARWSRKVTEENAYAAVARLSGFLWAVSSFSGELREFESFSFSIPIKDKCTSVALQVNTYYSGQHEFSFEETDGASYGLRQLEERIQNYLIRDKNCVSPERVDNLRRYLAFRIMDMVDETFAGDIGSLRVVELHENKRQSSDYAVFFGVLSDHLLLVLQFNHYDRPIGSQPGQSPGFKKELKR
jgi:hypothetical protein